MSPQRQLPVGILKENDYGVAKVSMELELSIFTRKRAGCVLGLFSSTADYFNLSTWLNSAEGRRIEGLPSQHVTTKFHHRTDYTCGRVYKKCEINRLSCLAISATNPKVSLAGCQRLPILGLKSVRTLDGICKIIKSIS